MMWPLIVVLVLLIPTLAIILDSSVGRALAARLERGRLDSGDMSGERLSYLEGEVDRLNSEVTRLTEESEFLHRLLTEGADKSADRALPEGDRHA